MNEKFRKAVSKFTDVSDTSLYYKERKEMYPEYAEELGGEPAKMNPNTVIERLSAAIRQNPGPALESVAERTGNTTCGALKNESLFKSLCTDSRYHELVIDLLKNEEIAQKAGPVCFNLIAIFCRDHDLLMKFVDLKPYMALRYRNDESPATILAKNLPDTEVLMKLTENRDAVLGQGRQNRDFCMNLMLNRNIDSKYMVLNRALDLYPEAIFNRDSEGRSLLDYAKEQKDALVEITVFTAERAIKENLDKMRSEKSLDLGRENEHNSLVR